MYNLPSSNGPYPMRSIARFKESVVCSRLM